MAGERKPHEPAWHPRPCPGWQHASTPGCRPCRRRPSPTQHSTARSSAAARSLLTSTAAPQCRHQPPRPRRNARSQLSLMTRCGPPATVPLLSTLPCSILPAPPSPSPSAPHRQPSPRPHSHPQPPRPSGSAQGARSRPWPWPTQASSTATWRSASTSSPLRPATCATICWHSPTAKP